MPKWFFMMFLLSQLFFSFPVEARKFQPYEGPLSVANIDFHNSYDKLLQHTIKNLGSANLPVLVMIGNNVVFHHNNQRKEGLVVPELYHRLKAISHIPFSIYLSLTGYGPGKLNNDQIQQIQSQLSIINDVEETLEEDFPAEMRPTQRNLLKNSRQFLEEVICAKKMDPHKLQSYTREIASVLHKDAYWSAKLQLEKLHHQVQAWLSELNERQKNNLMVVVGASHQARYREATMQYFERLLQEKAGIGAQNEQRLIFAEGIYNEKKALKLVAKHIIDQNASIAFFNNATRLQEDLLSEGAFTVLEQLKN